VEFYPSFTVQAEKEQKLGAWELGGRGGGGGKKDDWLLYCDKPYSYAPSQHFYVL